MPSPTRSRPQVLQPRPATSGQSQSWPNPSGSILCRHASLPSLDGAFRRYQATFSARCTQLRSGRAPSATWKTPVHAFMPLGCPPLRHPVSVHRLTSRSRWFGSPLLPPSKSAFTSSYVEKVTDKDDLRGTLSPLFLVLGEGRMAPAALSRKLGVQESTPVTTLGGHITSNTVSAAREMPGLATTSIRYWPLRFPVPRRKQDVSSVTVGTRHPSSERIHRKLSYFLPNHDQCQAERMLYSNMSIATSYSTPNGRI